MIAKQRSGSQMLQSSRDLDPLLEKIGDARFVLLGEASHGTHEYYTWRTAISKRLIEEKGFSFIAVEGDWPDCYTINRYVKNYRNAGPTVFDILNNFNRWPTWMWANWEAAALIEWIRDINRSRPGDLKVGFYGLDIYSLWESMEVIVNYLREEDPNSARLAVDAIRCFEPYGEGHDYAKALLSLSPDCSDQVLRLLKAVRIKSVNYDHDREASLNAEMNALVIANAEKYYRSMISFRDESWNMRDAHMVETLDALMKFHGDKSRCIVWEHNTHVGDARYTDMTKAGMYNVGQLVREERAREGVFLVGFASYEGNVVAARSWGDKMEVMQVPPARPNSIESILHNQSADNRLLFLDDDRLRSQFKDFLGHRAIGVVYNPEYDMSNYVPTLLPYRYDALVYIDRTQALHPMHLKADSKQMPETYPFGV
jgi:erythromycin esterase-like protein